jgi:hypothetical protein
MRNFGGLARAFEAAIDQTLGIDGAQAEAVLGIARLQSSPRATPARLPTSSPQSERMAMRSRGTDTPTAAATAAKEEGSFVDTAIGKDKAERLKMTLKESSEQLAGKLVQSAGNLAARCGNSRARA